MIYGKSRQWTTDVCINRMSIQKCLLSLFDIKFTYAIDFLLKDHGYP